MRAGFGVAVIFIILVGLVRILAIIRAVRIIVVIAPGTLVARISPAHLHLMTATRTGAAREHLRSARRP
jgi:hypothetical protein